jgi:nitroreductase
MFSRAQPKLEGGGKLALPGINSRIHCGSREQLSQGEIPPMEDQESEQSQPPIGEPPPAGEKRPGAEVSLDMPLAEAMSTQRAIRRLTDDPVDDGLVLRLLELALKAPTGSNAQNWEFVVVKDPAVKAALGRQNMRMWKIYGGLGRWLARNDEGQQRIMNAVQWQADHFDDIPVIVVACLRSIIPPWPPMAATGLYGSIYPSVQNLLLAARAAGLGAALITLPLWSTIAARRILGLPWKVTPCAVIPLGWPRGRYGPTTRRPVGDVVSLDNYGNRPWAGQGAEG